MESIRSTLLALFQDVRQLDVRQYEAEGPGPTLDELPRQLRTMVGRAIALAGEIQGRYDGPVGQRATAGDSSSPSAAGQVGDVAFMTVVELRQRLAPIEAPPTDDAWELVCDCASAIRCITMSLGALDRALCSAEQLPRLLGQDCELETSLKIRRLYRKLWHFVATVGDLKHADVRARLRSAGTLIAVLVGRTEYGRMRGNDRLQLRSLQRRIIAWLGHPAGEPRAAARIWEDFAGFARMLRQVNFRQELVQHDLEALALAERTLRELDPRSSVPQSLATVLQRLEGLDDGLDLVLDSRTHSPLAFLCELQRIQQRRAGPAAPDQASSAEAF